MSGILNISDWVTKQVRWGGDDGLKKLENFLKQTVKIVTGLKIF